jgi:Fur family transcriptional regulator, peroxide stress response regulator
MNEAVSFQDLCKQSGLAVTHQRQVVFESLASLPGHHHPSPEEVYERVKKLIPSISQATVYKTLHTFVQHGILRELSPHHGTLRVDANTEAHHHLICTKCKSVVDIEEGAVDPVKLRKRLPKGFQLERVAVEIQGICEKCSK